MVDRQRALPNISHQVGNNISGGDSGGGGDGGSSGAEGGGGGGDEGCEDDDVAPLTPAAQRPLLPPHTPRMGQATLPTLATAISMVDRQRALPNISHQVGNNLSGSGGGGGGGGGGDDDDADVLLMMMMMMRRRRRRMSTLLASTISIMPSVSTLYTQDRTLCQRWIDRQRALPTVRQHNAFCHHLIHPRWDELRFATAINMVDRQRALPAICQKVCMKMFSVS